MGFYRKIDTKIWSDSRFSALSRPKPNAQTLFLYLLTGPHTGQLPGIFIAGKRGLAEALGWSEAEFDQCFVELEKTMSVTADWRHRVVAIPKAAKYNLPNSPNQLKNWRRVLESLPDCTARSLYYGYVSALVKRLGPRFVEAFETTGAEDINVNQIALAEFSPEAFVEVKTSSKEKRKTNSKDISTEDCQKIIDFYNSEFEKYWKRPISLTPGRKSKLKSRLKNHSAEDIFAGIRALKASKWHCGDDPRNQKFYATLDFLIRSDEQLEKWCALRTTGRVSLRERVDRQWMSREEPPNET
jgi:hypothetical protein